MKIFTFTFASDQCDQSCFRCTFFGESTLQKSFELTRSNFCLLNKFNCDRIFILLWYWFFFFGFFNFKFFFLFDLISLIGYKSLVFLSIIQTGIIIEDDISVEVYGEAEQDKGSDHKDIGK